MTGTLSKGTAVMAVGEPAEVVKDEGSVLIVEFESGERKVVGRDGIVTDTDVEFEPESDDEETEDSEDDGHWLEPKDSRDPEESDGSPLPLPCGHNALSNIEDTASDWEIKCPRCGDLFMKEEIR